MRKVITLTTIPTRLRSKYSYDIKYCLDSLLEQNHEDYEVHLNIPHVFKRTGEEYIIPDWLENYNSNDKFNFFRTEDYGSATKLIPTLERTEDEDIIIVVDDDIVYHPEMLNEHIKNRITWPEYVVGYDGLRSRNNDGTFSDHFGNTRDYYYTANKRNALVDIIQHYKSVSYYRRFFESDFMGYWDEYGVWCDDKTVSAYFSMKKRGRLVTYFDGDSDFNTQEEWLEGTRENSFPVIKHTQYEPNEGCNLNRRDNLEEDNLKINILYKFIDNSYQGRQWTI